MGRSSDRDASAVSPSSSDCSLRARDGGRALGLSGWPAAQRRTSAGGLLFALGLTRSHANILATRESAESLARRRELAAARDHFAAELAKEQPQLDDRWFPYLLAFGLAPKMERWFRRFGTLAERRGSTYTSMAGGGGSFSGSGGSNGWSGGGGAFGGGGASATWAMAATAMSSGVSAPSSSGGGSSGGGSSGGGGGGGW